ncbi:MAG: leucine-rich repeat protein [Muribaculaceae bacterium]|nr:leucine-rich repeat protein [Muribaculaceae bacterium]
MKKILLSLLAIVCTVATASAAFTVDEFTYEPYQSTVTIIKADASISGNVVIPSQVSYGGETYTVVNIGGSSFLGCNQVTSITIPNTVTSIGGSAFWSCTSLESINIPSSVSEIFGSICPDCPALATITVDSASPYYDSRDNCNAIVCKQDIAINGTVYYPKDMLIVGCKNTVIPNTVTSIGREAFRGATGLGPTITIPSSVTKIDHSAFLDCSGLTSIVIPASVATIGDNPFNACCNLESIVVEAGNPNYDSRGDCNAIIQTSSNTIISGCQNTVFPTDVTAIGVKAFRGMSTLQSMVIPEGITSIGNFAFVACSALKSLTLPSTLNRIGITAFASCMKLEDVYCYPDQNTVTLGASVWQDVNRPNFKCNLHVYASAQEWYSTAEQWKEFNVMGDLIKDAALYLRGMGGDWSAEGAIALTKDASGMWTVTQEMAAGVEFKLTDQDDNWYGGTDTQYQITKEAVANGTELDLVDGHNFTIPVAGTWTLTVDPTIKKLVVSGTWNDVMTLKGSFDQWAGGVECVQGEDGKWTVTRVLQQGDTFKFVYNNTTWLGGDTGAEITEDMVTNGTALNLSSPGADITSPVFGEWTFTVDVENNLLYVSGQWPQPEYEHVYILGEVDHYTWDPNEGLEMTTQDGITYTAEVEFDGRGQSGENYFSFTTELGKSWDDIESFRFGAVSEGDYWFDDSQLGQPISLTSKNGQSIRIMAGNYTLTLNREDMTLVITRQGGTPLVGDVNLDGHVDVEDVNILVNIMLGTDQAANYDGRADVSGNDGKVDVADVNAIVNIMLGTPIE